MSDNQFVEIGKDGAVKLTETTGNALKLLGKLALKTAEVTVKTAVKPITKK